MALRNYLEKFLNVFSKGGEEEALSENASLSEHEFGQEYAPDSTFFSFVQATPALEEIYKSYSQTLFVIENSNILRETHEANRKVASIVPGRVNKIFLDKMLNTFDVNMDSMRADLASCLLSEWHLAQELPEVPAIEGKDYVVNVMKGTYNVFDLNNFKNTMEINCNRTMFAEAARLGNPVIGQLMQGITSAQNGVKRINTTLYPKKI